MVPSNHDHVIQPPNFIATAPTTKFMVLALATFARLVIPLALIITLVLQLATFLNAVAMLIVTVIALPFAHEKTHGYVQ